MGHSVFPFRDCLKGYVESLCQLVLGKPQLLAFFTDYLACFQMIHDKYPSPFRIDLLSCCLYLNIFGWLPQ